MTTEELTPEEVSVLASEKYRPLTGVWRWIGIAFPVVFIFLAINRVFDLRFFVDYMLFDYNFYYLLLAFSLPLAFLYVPVKPGVKGVWAQRLFWVDIALFFLAFAFGLYFAWHGFDVIREGWARVAPLPAVMMAVIIWFLIVEGVRRNAGIILGIVILVVSVYPVFAEHMPGILQGIGRPFLLTAQYHILSPDSAVGLFVRIYADIMLGFIFFGIAVIATGGGKFFLNLALSLVGGTRGGPAKVGVIASAMFGSLSGSSEVNVLTTGCVTIPAMKKAGYSPHYAGAVETCASTAGTFTPPIMGGTAFIMAAFLGISYAYIALAAAIPALLFYLGLFTQVDGYAAKAGLRGLAKGETPSLIKTLKDGWFYLPVVAVLIYYLFFLRLVGEAAFIATALMLVLAQIRKETRFTRKSFLEFIENTGQISMFLFVVTLGVGMLLGSFGFTGLALTFARELINLAGGNTALILILCAVASLIMGMGMTTMACYIFLAIVIAPALVLIGLDRLAVHLFVLYYGMLSYLTPPVALCAFPAAAIAGTTPMKVAFTAVRLGGVLYLLPFFFVLDPALILHGGVGEIMLAICTAALAVFLIGSAFEGYMVGIGRLWPARQGGYSLSSYLLRSVIIISGILLGLPWWQTKVLGLSMAFLILLPTFMIARRRRARETGYPV